MRLNGGLENGFDRRVGQDFLERVEGLRADLAGAVTVQCGLGRFRVTVQRRPRGPGSQAKKPRLMGQGFF